MRCVNKVILIGNLTRDPELRQTTNGQTVVTFGLATNREWMTKDGRKQQSAEFHELVAWAKLGEICRQYLKKGKLVYVEGYLKTRVKLLPDNTKKFRTEIVVQDMIMLDKRAGGNTDAEEAKILEATQDSGAGSSEPAAAADAPNGDVFEG
ncbi:single-stranded DNA-binding protein [Candidatus Peregrinibacteria bacterium]|nr:single-stranded DNA-binding protein [Candidatus Peregrinibacteria bacterium]